MYAFCPECNNRVVDHGRGGRLRCPVCNTLFPSRPMPGKFKGQSAPREPGEPLMDKRSEQYYYLQYGEPIAVQPPAGSGSTVVVEYDYSDDVKAGRPLRQDQQPAQPLPPQQQPAYYGPPPYPYYPPPPAYYQQQQAAQQRPEDSLINIFASLFAVIGLICFFSLYLFSLMSLGAAVVMVTPEMMSSSPVLFIPTLFPPFVVVLGYIPAGYAAAGYFLFIVAAILMSLFWLCYTEGREAWQQLKKRTNIFLLPPFTSKNSFFLIPQFFLALLFLNVVVIVLFSLFGVKTTTPESLGEDTPLWQLMYSLANASVWEEIATRVFFIGLPLGLVELYRRRAGRDKQYEMHQFILGGNMKIGGPELFLIFISSVMFGLAHVGSWDWWKFVPTFFSGLAFGYLFVIKGVHTAILLHFAFDYLSIPLDLFGSTTFEVAFSFALLFLMFLGMIFFIYFIIQFVVLLTKKMDITIS